MELKYKVVFQKDTEKGPRPFGTVYTRHVAASTNPSHHLPGKPVESEIMASRFFLEMQQSKTVGIVLPKGSEESVVRGLFTAIKGQSILYIEFTLLRNGTALEHINMYAVVKDFKAIDSGAYLVTFKLLYDSQMDEVPEKGLYCRVYLIGKTDFRADRIAVGGSSHVVKPLVSEVQFGRMFQLIKARKELLLVVSGKPGSEEHQRATHAFIHLMDNHSRVDIVVILKREGHGGISVHDYVASMELKKVRVIEYFTIEQTAYLARLKVTGATEVKDLSI